MSPKHTRCSWHIAVWKKYFGRKDPHTHTHRLRHPYLRRKRDKRVPFNWLWKGEQMKKLCRISQPGKDREKWQICVARYSGTDGLKYCFKPAEPTFFLYPPGICAKTIFTASLLLMCVCVCVFGAFVCNGESKKKEEMGKRNSRDDEGGEDEVVSKWINIFCTF